MCFKILFVKKMITNASMGSRLVSDKQITANCVCSALQLILYIGVCCMLFVGCRWREVR